MDLNTYLSQENALSVPALAVKSGIPHPSQIHQWRNLNEKQPPRYPGADYCAALEMGTEGLCTCEELNPNLKWRRIADPSWPWHPEGRPVIDPTHDAPVQEEGP